MLSIISQNRITNKCSNFAQISNLIFPQSKIKFLFSINSNSITHSSFEFRIYSKNVVVSFKICIGTIDCTSFNSELLPYWFNELLISYIYAQIDLRIWSLRRLLQIIYLVFRTKRDKRLIIEERGKVCFSTVRNSLVD